MKKNIICLLVMLIIFKALCIAQPETWGRSDQDRGWHSVDEKALYKADEEEQAVNMFHAINRLDEEAVLRLLIEGTSVSSINCRSVPPLFVLFLPNRPYTDDNVGNVQSILTTLLSWSAIVDDQAFSADARRELLFRGDTVLHIVARSYGITYMQLILAHHRRSVNWNALNREGQTPWDVAVSNPGMREWLEQHGGRSANTATSSVGVGSVVTNNAPINSSDEVGSSSGGAGGIGVTNFPEFRFHEAVGSSSGFSS